jgi:hypothetical protein
LRHIGPIGLDCDNRKRLIRNELLRDLGAHAIELARAVARFTDQHDFCIADSRQQAIEIGIGDRGERRCLSSDLLRQRDRHTRPPTLSCSSSDAGTRGAPADTRIASNGA